MDIKSVVKIEPNPNIPTISPGDTVSVSARMIEGGKQRASIFRGVVIRVRRGGVGANFTIRRVTHGVGVEHTFPLHSPLLEKVEISRHGKVRRAKLYYLRYLSTKKARLPERMKGKALATPLGLEEHPLHDETAAATQE